MKKKFSIKWSASRQRRKQRKYRYKAPAHIKHKFVSARLSKELRKKYGKRSLSLRKGDSVLIKTGEFKKKRGKITKVNVYNSKVYIEGIQKSRRDGTKTDVPVQPSNVEIMEIDLEDKKRKEALERKGVKK